MRIKNIIILPIFLTALFLAGCGNYSSVRIPYYLPENNNAVEIKKAVSALYIVVRTGSGAEENALGGVIGGLLKQQQAVDFDAYALAGKLAQALTRPGSSVKAFRVSRSAETADPYVSYFDPSGILEVRVSAPQISAVKEDRTTSYFDKKNKKQIVRSAVWVYSAAINADIKLVSGRESKLLDKTFETFKYSEERFDNKKDTNEWYEENQEKISANASARLSARYIGRQVLRYRPLFRKKDDKESASAADLAMREKWSDAEAIWNKRLDEKHDWRDMTDLAVAAEVRKDYSLAREYYLKAKDASAGDKDAKSVRWQEIFGDLDIMLSTGTSSSGGSDAWFSPLSAVLPFTDETTSVDGPPMLRTLIHAALKSGGYRVQSMEETDRLLLARGFSQGGQLGALERGELCKILGVERLFYGHINDFSEVMAGVYNRRMIKGRLSLWDLKERLDIWSEDVSVVKVKTPRNFIGGMFSQLAKGIGERLKNKPLAYESSLFATHAVETLPARLPK